MQTHDTMPDPTYELFALRYASNPRRTARDSFLMQHDVHDGPLPLDFFVWAAVCDGQVILIDGGANEGTCRARGHDFERCPADALRAIGLDPAAVTDLIVTHMHWDHAGNFDRFPNATLHVHPSEMTHATGPCMCEPVLRRPYDIEQVCAMLRALYGGRLRFCDDDFTVAPGITVHHMGGHTPGLQVVRVNTTRGRVVLASDAMHYFANATTRNPFPVVVHVDAYLKALHRVVALADTPAHVVPGHDPAVLRMYPPVNEVSAGFAVRLDAEPLLSSPLRASPRS